MKQFQLYIAGVDGEVMVGVYPTIEEAIKIGEGYAPLSFAIGEYTELSEAQDALYSYWCMEASMLNSDEDMDEIEAFIKNEVLSLTDNEAIDKLTKELS
jgi:hypothetical protein